MEALKIHIIWLTGLLFICSLTRVVCEGVSVCVVCDSTPLSATLCLGGVATSEWPQALTLPSLWNATPKRRPAMSCVKALQSSERLVLIHSPIMPRDCSLTKGGGWPLLLHALLISMCASSQSIITVTMSCICLGRRHITALLTILLLHFSWLVYKTTQFRAFPATATRVFKLVDSLTRFKCYLEYGLQHAGESVSSFQGHTSFNFPALRSGPEQQWCRWRLWLVVAEPRCDMGQWTAHLCLFRSHMSLWSVWKNPFTP